MGEQQDQTVWRQVMELLRIASKWYAAVGTSNDPALNLSRKVSSGNIIFQFFDTIFYS